MWEDCIVVGVGGGEGMCWERGVWGSVESVG